MKIIGSKPFERDETGRLKSRIGTVFLRTPGLVTTVGIHAMQRMAWIDEINKDRKSKDLLPLSDLEMKAEFANSVDLLFNDDFVLIRPVPSNMKMAFLADEAMQEYVSKRKIRYLNIQDYRVRSALRMRGEAWRMSPIPRSTDEINTLIQNAKVAINGKAIYYYNLLTGTRYLTAGTFASLAQLSDDELRTHLLEIKKNITTHNRFANPEITIFPPHLNITGAEFITYNFDTMPDEELRSVFLSFSQRFKNAIPCDLQDESLQNDDWRKAMIKCLIHGGNDISIPAIIEGLSPEFFMQIEWLPGGRIEKNELLFDPINSEYNCHVDDKELAQLCDYRARAILLNYLREYSNIEYINIGRTRRSLSKRTEQGPRAYVYIIEFKEHNQQLPIVKIIRIQKWTVIYHLNKNKSFLNAILEAEDYTDYVMDRRLGCRQLGMKLPSYMTPKSLREPYEYPDGTLIYPWTTYFVRDYVPGRATDKIPANFFDSKTFTLRFCLLLGKAAAANIIVGRATVNDKTIFDDGDEIIVLNSIGKPKDLVLSDLTGAFSNYMRPYSDDVQVYANAMNRRKAYIPDFKEAVNAYLRGFEKELLRIQSYYRLHRQAFDILFEGRPVDPAGSIAHRWNCVLRRLDNSDVLATSNAIKDKTNLDKDPI